MPEQLRVDINEHQSVTANIYKAAARERAGLTLILGHGAGSGQMSPFMVSFSNALASRGIDTVTFNFFYSEHGRGAPDRNDALEACYRAAIAKVRKHAKLKLNKLAIGGKSMGGRIASQVAASGEVEDIAGLVFLGYPLHPRGIRKSFARRTCLMLNLRCSSCRDHVTTLEHRKSCGQL
jgi:predicted alpha/beta-hydrolase family hydrolase